MFCTLSKSVLQLDRHMGLLHACFPQRLAVHVTGSECAFIGLASCKSLRHEAGCRRQGVGVLPDQGGPGDAVCPVRDRALPVRPPCDVTLCVVKLRARCAALQDKCFI